MSTMIIPMCNLLGVSAASMAARRIGDDEVRVAQLFYAVSFGSLLLLWLGGDKSGVLALGLLALSTTCMMAVNTMLISVLPARYGRIGKTSGVSGILNSCVYAGSSASTYGIGALSAAAGWKMESPQQVCRHHCTGSAPGRHTGGPAPPADRKAHSEATRKIPCQKINSPRKNSTYLTWPDCRQICGILFSCVYP